MSRAAQREALLAIISGQRRDLGACLMRGMLRGCSWLFGAVVRVRGRFYDQGWCRSARAGVPVVSIGNLTAGGTGKTPLAMLVARRAMEAGRRVAVLSRGWGGEGAGPIRNEEGRLLARHLPGVVVLQGADRAVLAREAVDAHACDLLLLDDGFQHRRLARDLDIVTIDATCPFGYGHLLPRGLLREPPAALRRASSIIVTRRDQIAADRLEPLRARLRRTAPRVPLVTACHQAVALHGLDGVPGPPLADLQDRAVLLLSAIGNPAAFERTMRDLGANVLGHRRLPDHHRYSLSDIAEIVSWARHSREGQAVWVVTTEKDAIKLSDRLDALKGDVPFWALEIEMKLDGEIPGLEDLLAR